jgi:4-alpha-methyl-delta7-sterol-4alpha-methyl oxidase
VQYLINNFSDFQLASIGSFVIHESVFFLSGLPFIVMERLGYQQKYKIQVHLDVIGDCSCSFLPCYFLFLCHGVVYVTR